MSFLLQIANVSSGAGSLAGKVKFVEDAEVRKNLPYATQAMAYKMSKAALNMREHHLLPTAACWLLSPQSALRWPCKAASKLQEHVQIHMEDATPFVPSATHSCIRQVRDVQRPSPWQPI